MEEKLMSIGPQPNSAYVHTIRSKCKCVCTSYLTRLHWSCVVHESRQNKAAGVLLKGQLSWSCQFGMASKRLSSVSYSDAIVKRSLELSDHMAIPRHHDRSHYYT